MLLRVVCAIDDKKILSEIEKRISELDVQLKISDPSEEPWHELTRSCADIFIVSRPLIPRPVESSINLLNTLPEKPTTIVLHDSESSEEHANLLAAGVDVVLYSGIPMESLCEAIDSTIESRRQFNYSTRFDQRGRFQPRLDDFVSNSREMQLFLDQIHQIVPSDSTLLLLGETGVGKEHLSKAIHAESHRSKGPFVALNMAAIPEQLLESELFGHEKGAFTGAVRSRRGAFEMAHQGSLFLDEIGEMSLQVQSKLLRVLQDMEFTPVGGERPIWVDTRIIAATNRDLEQEIDKGHFRKDLYYRLSVITLTLPPLRKRKTDIPSMANHFLNISNKKVGKEINRFSKEAMDALCTYNWPGNIRELMNVIERAVLLCRSDMIVIEDLPLTFQSRPFSISSLFNPAGPGSIDWEGKTLSEVKSDILSQVEHAYLEMVLKKTRGRIGQAAAIAGIHPRGLYEKMKKYSLDKSRFK